jgi:hypothetical protein
METSVTFIDCPSCGLPAEVEHRYTVTSTDGPLESAKIRCPRGHWFSGPLESLTRATIPTGPHQTAASAGRPTASARRPSVYDPQGQVQWVEMDE